MQFLETSIPGTFTIEIEPARDERGFFARSFDEEEFRAHGLDPHVAQCGISFNARRGTLRGMHFQAAPHQEAKLVRCTAGAVYDVVLDLRPGSPSYRRWQALELTPRKLRMLYIPPGCAHGFMTLTDDAEVFYQISAAHVPDAARGVRWNDPAFGIDWPGEPSVIAPRDAEWPLWTEPRS